MGRNAKFRTPIEGYPLILVQKVMFAPLTGIAGIDGFPTTFEHPEAFLNAYGCPLACKASLLKVLRVWTTPSHPEVSPIRPPSGLNLDQNDHFLEMAIRRGEASKTPPFNRETNL